MVKGVEVQYQFDAPSNKIRASFTKTILGTIDKYSRKGSDKTTYRYRGKLRSACRPIDKRELTLYVLPDEIDSLKKLLREHQCSVVFEWELELPSVSIEEFNAYSKERLVFGEEAPFGAAIAKKAGDMYQIEATIELDTRTVRKALELGPGLFSQQIERSLAGKFKHLEIEPPDQIFDEIIVEPRLPSDGVFIFCRASVPMIVACHVQLVVHSLYNIWWFVNRVLAPKFAE